MKKQKYLQWGFIFGSLFLIAACQPNLSGKGDQSHHYASTTQTSYASSGKPWWISTDGTNVRSIKAGHFDRGGEGVAYHDQSSSNNLSSSNAARTNEGVETTKDYFVQDFTKNEWLEYTVKFQKEGIYEFSLVGATSGNDARIDINVIGVTSGVVTIPQDSLTAYKTVKKTLTISSKGKKVIRLKALNSKLNLKWLKIKRKNGMAFRKFPHNSTYSNRGIKPNSDTQNQMNSTLKRVFEDVYEDFVKGPDNDPSGVVQAGELRVIEGASNETRINQISMMMMGLVVMDDGGQLDLFDGTTGTYQNVFDRLERFYQRYRLAGNPSFMSWRIYGDGTAANGPGFVGEQNRMMAMIMAYNQWGNSSYLDKAKQSIDHLQTLGVVTTNETYGANNTKRKILIAGKDWGEKDGEYMVDFGGQSPAFFRAFYWAKGNNGPWLNVRTSTYWMLANLRNQTNTHYQTNQTTGLIPNFMNMYGEQSFSASREYYDELDTALANFRLVLDKLWFNSDSAKTQMKKQADWWLSQHSDGKFKLSESYRDYQLNGVKIGSQTTPVRSGGLALAAMIAGTNSNYQNMVNSGYEILRDLTYRNQGFRDFSKLTMLMILTGNMPKSLAIP